VRLVLILVLISALTAPSGAAQAPIDVKELAEYRLTGPVLTQFAEASGLIMTVTRRDARFTYAPLFTKEVALSGDAPTMATGLVARLENDLALVEALKAAKLTPREYATFALALFAARVAHGFVESGVLRRVPAGAPADNVEFVGAHQAEITAVLDTLGVRD
jgi:hypothetical protein